MKKLIGVVAIVVFCSVGCYQRTERETSATETTETTTVTVDTAAVDTAAAADAAKDAAHETGTAMETAGKELQEQTKTDTK